VKQGVQGSIVKLSRQCQNPHRGWLGDRNQNLMRVTAMDELLRSGDRVLISFIVSLLKESEIEHLVVDQNMSILEGSLVILPRIIVDSDDLQRARRLMTDAGLADELPEINDERSW